MYYNFTMILCMCICNNINMCVHTLNPCIKNVYVHTYIDEYRQTHTCLNLRTSLYYSICFLKNWFEFEEWIFVLIILFILNILLSQSERKPKMIQFADFPCLKKEKKKKLRKFFSAYFYIYCFQFCFFFFHFFCFILFLFFW